MAALKQKMALPQPLVASDFGLLEELHRSSGGTVWLGVHKPTKRKVVLKERRAAELGGKHGIDSELKLYERVPAHNNLIAYLGQYRRSSSRGDSKEVLVMVFEHATQGDLHQALLKQRSAGRYLSETQVLQWFVPIAAGVRHLHAHGIVHRDLKSLNIVLQGGVPKICDLGISRYRSEDTVMLQSFCGTPAYLAPEMVGSKPYTEKADVWALGVLLYELAALRLPFIAQSILEISQKIARGEYPPLPSHYSPDLTALMARMLHMDMSKRPSVEEAIKRATDLLASRAKLHAAKAAAAAGEAAADAPDDARAKAERDRRRRAGSDLHPAPAEEDLPSASPPPAPAPAPAPAPRRDDDATTAALPPAAPPPPPSRVPPQPATDVRRASDDEVRSNLPGGGNASAAHAAAAGDGGDANAAARSDVERAAVPLARAPPAQLAAFDARSRVDPACRPGSSSAGSVREQRLAQRMVERRERRPGTAASSASSSVAGAAASPNRRELINQRNDELTVSPAISAVSSMRSEGVPIAVTKLPRGEALPAGHEQWTPQQLSAYLLARQLASMQRGSVGSHQGWPASATPQLPPGSAAFDPASVASTRPGTATPPWLGANESSTDGGWFNNRHVDQQQALARQRQQQRSYRQRQLFSTPELYEISSIPSTRPESTATDEGAAEAHHGAAEPPPLPPPAAPPPPMPVPPPSKRDAWSAQNADGLLPAAQVNRLRAGSARERPGVDARAGVAARGRAHAPGVGYDIITGCPRR